MKIKEFKENQDWIMDAFLNNEKVAFIDQYGDIADKTKLKEIKHEEEIMFVSNICQQYSRIKQIKTETRVKCYKHLMFLLIEKGYIQQENGDWESYGHMTFYYPMFEYCGKPICYTYQWNKEWLEEVEIE